MVDSFHKEMKRMDCTNNFSPEKENSSKNTEDFETSNYEKLKENIYKDIEKKGSITFFV